MGTPAVREFKPTPHQLFTAELLINQCKELSQDYRTYTLKFEEAALCRNKLFWNKGYFKWDNSSKTGEVIYRLGIFRHIKWKTNYILYFYPDKANIGIPSVKCCKFFTYGELIGLWHPGKLMWELVEKGKI